MQLCNYQAGLLDRWGTPGRTPPLEKDPQTLVYRDCPRRGRERGGADTGPADSVDTDSGPSTASTFGLTDMLRGDVAADGAVYDTIRYEMLY